MEKENPSATLTEPAVRAACGLHSSLPPPPPVRRPPLGETLAEIRRTAALPLDQSTTLPPEAYCSPEFFQWETDHVLAPGWQCVAHVSQLLAHGDFTTLDLLGEPLVIIRGKDGVIRALSRICPHRGMDIMPPGFGRDGNGMATERTEGCGHTRLFLCPYHAWTFELDGRLKACPEMHEATGFRRDAWGLPEYRCEVWQGFVFVNLDGTADTSVAEQLAPIAGHVSLWNPAEAVIAVERTWDCPFDWKVLVENFMESYHHAGAHRHSLQLLMPARDTWTEPERPHFIRCHLPYRDKIRSQIRETESRGETWDVFPPIPGLPDRERHEWGLILGYPHFLLATAPESLVWYRLQPLGAGRLRLFTTLLVPKETTARPDYAERLARAEEAAIGFHLEDMECCTAVQRGYSARGSRRGRLSHLEMPIWLFQRYLASRSIP